MGNYYYFYGVLATSVSSVDVAEFEVHVILEFMRGKYSSLFLEMKVNPNQFLCVDFSL